MQHTNTRAPTVAQSRRYPAGAELGSDGTVSFRVWAPARTRVSVVIEDGSAFALSPEGDGYHTGTRNDLAAGALYSLRLDDEPRLLPDPASRFQPRGHLGPSQIVDPYAYPWRDGDWRGIARAGQVIYEMHIGTFTAAGTWRAAAALLPSLAALGITVIEVMPIGEFPGRFGWGYDVVHFFAPTHLYGMADDARSFVDTAHGLGLGVILDVVYNHCASIDCFLGAFSEDYLSRTHKTDWGGALNFDGENAKPVREFFVSNADYWIREFHLDGLRLDATQSIHDRSPTHILSEIAAAARAAAGAREILLVGENEPQHASMLASRSAGGAGLDALWNDDFHHSARVALTGRTEAYYHDYRGAPQEFVSAAKRGFLYQGQRYEWQGKPRGTPTRGLTAERFVCYLQNHDQVANAPRGLRLTALTTPGRLRAATVLLLLSPQTPMLFQGQEFAASAPFVYFADNAPEHAKRVADGRREFLRQFQSVAAGGDARVADPASPESFQRCKLDHAERERHAHVVAFHRDLIALRRRDGVFRSQRADAVDGAVIGPEAFLLRYFGAGGDDRLVIVNFGRQFDYNPCPEPLLAAPVARQWVQVLSSEDVAYGGEGTAPATSGGAWQIPAHAALVFAARSGGERAPRLPGQEDAPAI